MSQTLTQRIQEHASGDIPILSACIRFITPCTLDMNIFEQTFLQTVAQNNVLNQRGFIFHGVIHVAKRNDFFYTIYHKKFSKIMGLKKEGNFVTE
jgi:hypothetical protein